jgi:hypothetical protein
MNLDLIPKINRLVLFRPEQDVLHVLHVDKPDFQFTIEGLATRVWLAIDGRRNVREVLSAAENGIVLSSSDRKRFFKDAQKFLSQLTHEDLVQTSEPKVRE